MEKEKKGKKKRKKKKTIMTSYRKKGIHLGAETSLAYSIKIH